MEQKKGNLLAIDSLLDELYSYSMHGIKLGLENIQRLCKQLGNPQNKYKIIHVAGTNGKGSTSTTVEAILLEAGYTVGKYTSPHILQFNERIRADGMDISDEEIASYYNIVKIAIEEIDLKPTFFEVTTAIMFKYFADKKLDYVVLETGMGGRFDATNITSAEVAVITNVDLEHTEYLGNTIYDIAKEKAGIIKNCKNIVVGSDNQEFLKAINEGRTKDSKLINVIEKYKNIDYQLDFDKFITKIFLNGVDYEFSLFGDYQVNNFLCAYETAKILKINDSIIKKAAKKVKWQCRFEKITIDEQRVILDGAHNLNGVKTLVNTLQKAYKPDEIVVITSILKDKDIKSMISELEKISDNIVLTSIPNNPRGLKGSELLEFSKDAKKNIVTEDNILKAYDCALSYGKKLILICGSFYLLGLFKEALSSQRGEQL